MKNKIFLLFSWAVITIITSCSTVQEKPRKKEVDKSSIISSKVSTAILERADFPLQTISNGILQPSVSVELFFEIPGILEKINYNNGQYINKGSIIATLKNDRYRLALRKAEELLKAAETELYSLILGFRGKQGDTSSVGNSLLQSLKSQSGYTMA